MQALIRLSPCTLLSRSRQPLDFDIAKVIFDTSIMVHFRSSPLSTPYPCHFQHVEYTRIFPAVQHQYLESPAPQDGLTNLPETPLSVDQFQLTKLPYPNVRPLILTLKAGFSSYLDLTTDQMTTILLKVMLLSQRTLDSSYPGVTQDTQRTHNTDNAMKSNRPRVNKGK